MKYLLFVFLIVPLAFCGDDNITPPHADPNAPLENHDSLLSQRVNIKYQNVDLDEPISPKLLKKAGKKTKKGQINPVKMLAEILFGIYSKYITPQDDQNCQFEPSCSAYAREAFKCKNPICASMITSERLLRCHPMAFKYYPKNEDGFLIDSLEGECNE